ncbi:MAG: hypothetical protein IJW22_04055 [Clostridia bacterium]|nr:hypothetical protein [Clostridia bacterium]
MADATASFYYNTYAKRRFVVVSLFCYPNLCKLHNAKRRFQRRCTAQNSSKAYARIIMQYLHKFRHLSVKKAAYPALGASGIMQAGKDCFLHLSTPFAIIITGGSIACRKYAN